jgi:prepilin-type N-terminal cleavage/methylation domain-containing protein
MKIRAKVSRFGKFRGFSLVELLVVIVIIAILAGVAMPAFGIAKFNAKMNASMQQARQIGLALLTYSGDHDGNYPTFGEDNVHGEKIATSNDAFRSLVPDYIDNEAIFAVSTSKWGPSADGRIKTPAEILKAGENHYAYVSGLTGNSGSMKPLIVDGTDGSGHYTRNEGEKGGTWRGQKAILIRNDSSARLVPLKGEDDQRYIPDTEDDELNLLDVGTTVGSDAKLLDPS